MPESCAKGADEAGLRPSEARVVTESCPPSLKLRRDKSGARGGYGVMATQQVVALLLSVRIRLVAPKIIRLKKPLFFN